MIYLDTCALMKLVHPEGETAALRDFLKRRVTIPKFTATVALAELPRAVRRASHHTAGQPGEFLKAEREQAQRLLDTLRMIDVTRAVLTDAAEIDGPLLRTLDAVHLVAASRIRGSLTAFVTYDKKLAAAAQQAGLPVLSPG